jgi:hypothetical protein
MSKNQRRGGKDSQEESSKTEKCSNQTCEIYAMVVKIMRGEKGISIGKSELNHLNRYHFRTWADFGWACSAAYKDDNVKLVDENKKLTAELTKLTTELSKLKSVTTGDAPVADPRNHVDGFCDALIMHPSGVVFKCTEYCKYGSGRCGTHQKYAHVLKNE